MGSGAKIPFDRKIRLLRRQPAGHDRVQSPGLRPARLQISSGGAKNSSAMPSGSRKLTPEPYDASLIPPCSMPSSSSRRAHFSSSPRSAQPKATWSRPTLNSLNCSSRRGRLVLVQPEEHAVADQVHGVVEVGVGVLVEHRLGVEERLVPGNADGQVADGERDMGDRGKRGHGLLFPGLGRHSCPHEYR